MIKAEIIKDSLDPRGNRLTTWVLTYPRLIHAEFMTHRMFSKNAASSRAIPMKKMIKMVKENPAGPQYWGANQSGMQAKKELSGFKLWLANKIWYGSRYLAIGAAWQLNKVGLHKQIGNRILEPWMHITVLASGTEWENFFALRAHKDAQPEFQELARQMLEAYNISTPKKLKGGEWHIPFSDKLDSHLLWGLMERDHPDLGFDEVSELYTKYKVKVSTARCARISYLTFEGKDDYDADIKLHDRLLGSAPLHASPGEHIARVMTDEEYHDSIRANVIEDKLQYQWGWCRNFRGFIQYRATLPKDTATDKRVIKHG